MYKKIIFYNFSKKSHFHHLFGATGENPQYRSFPPQAFTHFTPSVENTVPFIS